MAERPPLAPPALEARDVAVRIDGTSILHGIDVAVPAVGLTALLGPNGSGKSTLLRVLAGIDAASEGSVLVGDVAMATLARRERALRLAFVEQEAATDLALTVQQVAMLGRLPHQGLLGGATHDDRRIVDDALERTGATRWRDRAFASLSGGERQRVRLAAALAQQPRILVLDEPTNHLDVRAALETMALLRAAADDGVTVLAALHDLTLAGHADHAVLLADGAVEAHGPTSEVLTPDRIERVYGVRAAVGRHPLSGRLSVQVDLP